ncbi:MAG: PD40 domain-containing protein [Anaerolineae bacterium]|nr:PD40 domain-containing protein [Anaerolineae bacterium]
MGIFQFVGEHIWTFDAENGDEVTIVVTADSNSVFVSIREPDGNNRLWDTCPADSSCTKTAIFRSGSYGIVVGSDINAIYPQSYTLMLGRTGQHTPDEIEASTLPVYGSEPVVSTPAPEETNVLRYLLAHTAQVVELAWSADSTRLASLGADDRVRVWEIRDDNYEISERGNEIVRKTLINLTTDRDADLAWSPDGTRLALASPSQEKICIWNFEVGEVDFCFQAHTHDVTDIDWSPDGSLIASAEQGRTVLVWDAATSEVVYTFTSDDAAYNTAGIAWSPDGSQLAISQSGLYIMDAQTGRVAAPTRVVAQRPGVVAGWG